MTTLWCYIEGEIAYFDVTTPPDCTIDNLENLVFSEQSELNAGCKPNTFGGSYGQRAFRCARPRKGVACLRTARTPNVWHTLVDGNLVRGPAATQGTQC